MYFCKLWLSDVSPNKIRRELATIEKQFSYVPDSTSYSTSILRSIRHTFSLSVKYVLIMHSYCVTKFSMVCILIAIIRSRVFSYVYFYRTNYICISYTANMPIALHKESPKLKRKTHAHIRSCFFFQIWAQSSSVFLSSTKNVSRLIILEIYTASSSETKRFEMLYVIQIEVTSAPSETFDFYPKLS